MFRIKVIIGLGAMLILMLTGCVVKEDVSDKPITEAEDLSSEEQCGYSVGNASLLYGDRKVAMAGNEIIFAINVNGRGTLNKCKQKGGKQQVLYEHKSGYISNINANSRWIIFLLTETKEDVDQYYICKLKTDGSCFEKISETRIEDMWLYGNDIYFSKYSKRGATGIFSMDMDGKNVKLLLDRENIWFEIYDKKIYCMDLGELTVEDDDVDLFQLDMADRDRGFQKIATFKAMSGKMDRVCLKEKDVYYLDVGDGRLYRRNIDNSDAVLLTTDVSEFCIQNNRIYCIKWTDTGEEDEFCVLNPDGTCLKTLGRGNLKKGYVFNGVLGECGYFTSDSIECIEI